MVGRKICWVCWGANLVRKHNSSLKFQFLVGFNKLVPLNLIKVNIIILLYLYMYIYLQKMPD